MVHCGYEATAVADTFGSLKAFSRVAYLTMFGSGRETLPPDQPNPDHHARDRQPISEDERIQKIELPVLSS